MKIKALFLMMAIATMAHAGEGAAETPATTGAAANPSDFTSLLVYALLAALLTGSLVLYAKVRSAARQLELKKRKAFPEQAFSELKRVDAPVQEKAAVA